MECLLRLMMDQRHIYQNSLDMELNTLEISALVTTETPRA